MVKVSKAERSDIERIVFFQQAMAKETENLYLNNDTLKDGVTAVFDYPEKGCYYVAKIENQMVGSLMITYEWSDWRNKTVWWIQSVYVQPTYREKGVYRALNDFIQAQITADPTIGGVRLYVDKRNTKAQEVYTKMGMSGEHYSLFEKMK